jgi:hypothetical protein
VVLRCCEGTIGILRLPVRCLHQLWCGFLSPPRQEAGTGEGRPAAQAYKGDAKALNVVRHRCRLQQQPLLAHALLLRGIGTPIVLSTIGPQARGPSAEGGPLRRHRRSWDFQKHTERQERSDSFHGQSFLIPPISSAMARSSERALRLSPRESRQPVRAHDPSS